MRQGVLEGSRRGDYQPALDVLSLSCQLPHLEQAIEGTVACICIGSPKQIEDRICAKRFAAPILFTLIYYASPSCILTLAVNP